MEGMRLNASERVFSFTRKTILNGGKRLPALNETLFLYALVHEFLQLTIEGDELYTKVHRNEQPSDSEGWTIVLLERASRFIWTLKCGKKEQRLFLEAVATLLDLFDHSEAIALFTDGERRYGKLLFEVCHNISSNSKTDKRSKTGK